MGVLPHDFAVAPESMAAGINQNSTKQRLMGDFNKAATKTTQAEVQQKRHRRHHGHSIGLKCSLHSRLGDPFND
ncbi:MAG: hypothetical protein AAFR26_15870 [Cyanobacteria bacterium J06626_4]